ncbi:LCP family protein [Sphaerisporangium corydalis]|uniref:LCP family protein n=1 Tax=Sphaerisporangium corydalis TaxID=1441875 RepID=A0ABV9ES18_9ACTN|nr:LCP family protein [Sphaerisporangium corydalis]
MDDLTMLRDLGRDLEHEPPASLARQRHRLLGLAAGDGPLRRTSGLIGGDGRRRRLGWAMLIAVAGVTAVLVVIPTVLLRGTPASSTLAPPSWDRPPKRSETLNVLLVGSDKRPPPKAMPTMDLGERSDVMLLVHLPADRRNVTVVSLPRDSLVQIPACTTSDGKTSPSHVDMINQAFSIGGLNCAWKTVESVTGVRVDHVIQIRYSGFEDIVDALGGVEVTLPTAVDDRFASLRLAAGKHHLNGETALAYVRARRLGDGSDLQRIKRQQALMRNLLKRVSGLRDPARLAVLVEVVRKSITTDAGLDLETMYSIVGGVQKSEARVMFVTVPHRPSTQDPNRIEWRQPEADRLFADLKN